jgi:hypothetical protein
MLYVNSYYIKAIEENVNVKDQQLKSKVGLIFDVNIKTQSYFSADTFKK